MHKILTTLASLILCVSLVVAQSQERARQFNVGKSGLAIGGYDPVSYFSSKEPLEGKKEFTHTHEGITYRFATLQNKQAFISNPARYEPQYGGWCAYAMGDSGEKVEIDPETFKIADGKLYLFYNKYFNNTLKSWNKNEAKLKASADKLWKAIYH